MATSTKATAPVPDWITKEFFVDVITTKLARPVSEFEITDLNVKPATESGDNYASVLYRVQVTVEVQGSPVVVPLIVKALPNLGITNDLIQSMNLFPRETDMYGQVLPALEKLYAERGRVITFGPRCLKLCSKPTTALVLEDLRERDFRMANRRQGLDMDHSRMLLRRLAQFHAASAVYCEQNGPYDDKFQEAMFAEKGRAMHEQFQKLQSDFMYMIFSNWSDKGKYFAEIMVG
ncbi:CHKov1 [Anopheles darlingi]|uniref:CHKov1 n=1 Tax=Anopheles darlingi TaxID=43151 RepID=W5JA20_ANODA|nr:CHKov1 [Anopheles darlingi]